MSENMAQGIAEEIEKNREAFFALGSDGLNTLHSPALGGSAACVKALLEAGADPRAKTKSGKTALDLATMMEWPRVVGALARRGSLELRRGGSRAPPGVRGLVMRRDASRHRLA